MLTAFQCEVVAYWSDDGPVCLDCGRDKPLGDRSISEAELSRYSLDEYQAENAYGMTCDGNGGWAYDGDEPLKYDECEPAVFCADCGMALNEEYHYHPEQ